MSLRGIIVTSKFDSTPDGRGINISGGIDPAALRQYALYWDKIDWPDNNIIGIGAGPLEGDIKLLSQEGILQRTRLLLSSFSSDNWGGARLHATMQMHAFVENNRRHGEEWAIAQPHRLLLLPDELGVDRKVLEIQLYEALPVPPPDVPLEEILDFKAKCRDDLIVFR